MEINTIGLIIVFSFLSALSRILLPFIIAEDEELK